MANGKIISVDQVTEAFEKAITKEFEKAYDALALQYVEKMKQEFADNRAKVLGVVLANVQTEFMYRGDRLIIEIPGVNLNPNH